MGGSRRSFLLGLLIIAATVCLVLGLTLPIIRLTQFYVWTDVHSLISVVRELYLADELMLASVVFTFSIVFPFLKLLYLLALYSIRHVQPNHAGRWLKRLSWLGKWSMLDVLVLALVVFYAKAANLADAMSMPGIYLFAAAVLLTMIATAMIEYEIETDLAMRGDGEVSLPGAKTPDGPDRNDLDLRPLLDTTKPKM
jgi:paraquat-inducible protein A